jgi:hypothetical protein
MRLLERKPNGDLVFHEAPVGNVPTYAILSHTWLTDNNEEVSFQDVQAGTGKNKDGWKKIQFCANKATADGFRYLWIDTCCIDKSSSAELSESINSMVRWYADAELCYAYLADVTFSTDSANDEEIGLATQTFVESRWFQRGWTLQELIFPAHVHFYSADWHYIGSKRQLSRAISHLTGIDHGLLIAQSPETMIDEYSIAERMSWASKRTTTRPEDIAYCLLGLFGVNIALLYGEGSLRAFWRLQEAIIRKSDDHSILTWIDTSSGPNGDNDGLPSIQPLAESPAGFTHSGTIIQVLTGAGYPSMKLTTRGLSINLQIDRTKFPNDPDMCIAWLDCAEKGDPNRISIALQYIPRTQTYLINRRFVPESIPAPLKSPRETILLDDLTSYATMYRTFGRISFSLRYVTASDLRGFELQQVFPDAGWLPRSQTIIAFEVTPGNWRFGLTFKRSQQEQFGFAIIAGFSTGSHEPRIWCSLTQWSLSLEELEGMVRTQVSDMFTGHHATLSLSTEVVMLEISPCQANGSATAFNVLLKIGDAKALSD